MHCPACRTDDTKVVDSRLAEDGNAVRRRRECLDCGYRFTTFERMDEVPLLVVKSDGTREGFDRAKVIAGVSAASKGRSLDETAIEALVDGVDEEMRAIGTVVSTAQVGVAVLDRLRLLDDVAYLRFASVYKDFDAAADFHREIELLSKSDPAPTA